MEITKERVNEVAYAFLLVQLSKDSIEFNPQHLKRKLGNLPQTLQHLPEQFRDFSPEELQSAFRIIAHDLVNYAFSFDLKKKNRRRRRC